MNRQTKRQFLMMGLGAVAFGGAAVAVMAMSGGAPDGWEHRVMAVDEMTANTALLVDIRTPPEWVQTGVIDGATLITFDFDKPDTFLPQIAAEIADGRDLVLICRSGNRTQLAAEFLAKQIDNRIVSIEGGIKKVIASGYRPVPPA
jgi:rhodanese-related sulfurtransferase